MRLSVRDVIIKHQTPITMLTFIVGFFEGDPDGPFVGLEVTGLWLGDTVGSDVGLRLGDLDGLDVLGDTVGGFVGLGVILLATS